MKTRLFIFAFAFLPLVASAQNTGVYQPKFTYNIELGLPVATSNEPFRDIMQGLVTLNTYQEYNFPFHLNIGLGIKYSYFTVNEFAISEPVFGGIHSGGGFLKVGWQQFHGDIFATDFGVKFGYAGHMFITDVNKANGVNPLKFQNVFVEPVFSLILKADQRNSYRLNLGYTFYGFPYQPTDIGLASNGDYSPETLDNASQFFFVGFGYSFYFGEKASD